MGGHDEGRGPHPSDTGAPGGREVGQKVSHYIEAGGVFARACGELVASGFDPLYVELWGEGGKEKRTKKAASKTKYTCPACHANAWAKPQTSLVCGDCDEPMQAQGAPPAGAAEGYTAAPVTMPKLSQGAT